jgi:peroxiredoxin
VLLVFTDPHCAPCDQLAPHLVRLHREDRGTNLAVVMVVRGDLEENRFKAQEHGFEFPVVLQEHWRLSKAYGIFATPVAFLIDEDGVIVRNVAQGVDETLALAREGFTAEQEGRNGRAV